jgi:LPXTG-motif cell wall-anchored protein
MARTHNQAITRSLLACGLLAFAPGTSRAQDNHVLPLEKTPDAMLTGCFLRETVDNHERYVLTNPIVGSVASVPDGTCTSSGQVVKLERIKKRTLDVINVGTYVTVTGKLEKAHGSHNNGCQCPVDEDKHLREFEVSDASEVPVIPPRVAEVVMPAPAPAPYIPPAAAAPEATPPAVAAAPETPAPIGTTGVKEKKHKRLPRTASQLPLTGLMGLLALTGGLALHFRRRQSV